MDKAEFLLLLEKYENGKCTDAERELVELWYLDRIDQSQDIIVTSRELRRAKRLILDGVLNRRRRALLSSRAIPIAALVALSFLATYFLVHTKDIFESDGAKKNQLAIIPGGSHAYLTTAEGQQIVLDRKANGQITEFDGGRVRKTGNGIIIYELSQTASSHRSTTEVNTITTPRGGQYEVVLPDGSHAVLNAESKLTFPTRFDGSDRRVELEGEGYFEVAKNAAKPFYVVNRQQCLKVIGTHFNVSCYNSSPVVTTLVEGKVEISRPNFSQKTILHPGDQSITDNQGVRVHQVDTDDALAWKDGNFVFSQIELKQALTEIGRWYDLEVDYQSIPASTIEASMSRSVKIEKALSILGKASKLNLKIEGRRIICMK
ncbi:FecR family protein [Pedobacter paludis]|uniref:Anti-sigma factor n=1 Tax=Pedobacter paludis TaxID=2203212 RepID=A0A317F2D8_9SPHI|nr:FecR family protein [Pedobacter paludis]PWS32207.1 hypothetical protein DF947_10585 [Pedobacter paludis]